MCSGVQGQEERKWEGQEERGKYKTLVRRGEERRGEDEIGEERSGEKRREEDKGRVGKRIGEGERGGLVRRGGIGKKGAKEEERREDRRGAWAYLWGVAGGMSG